MMKWNIDFISEDDFRKNIEETIKKYYAAFSGVDLINFNSNVVDPIKLLFDMKVYGKTKDELIEDEINRQIDKTNSNAIGYFNQYMFKYIANCIVPETGFDIIYTNPINEQKIYVEMKNKHNTMNDGGKNTVLEKMKKQIEKDPNSICYLVEVISGKSRNEVWRYKQNSDERIRRVSIDKFYAEVTGIKNAFKLLCDYLPYELDNVIKTMNRPDAEDNNVYNQLCDMNPDIIKALFLLAFASYEGFNED